MAARLSHLEGARKVALPQSGAWSAMDKWRGSVMEGPSSRRGGSASTASRSCCDDPCCPSFTYNHRGQPKANGPNSGQGRKGKARPGRTIRMLAGGRSESSDYRKGADHPRPGDRDAQWEGEAVRHLLGDESTRAG